MNSNVYFKATKDNIIVMLDDNSDFTLIKNDLKEKVSKSKRFFGNAKTSLLFKGRAISTAEEKELLDIICAETDLDITSVIREQNQVKAVGQNPGGLSLVTSDFNKLISWDNNDAIFHKGNIRSGMSIKHKGSIIVIGDVNPGGEIIAEGNIIILGSLKGLAHAGSGGNDECFVAALKLMATQLRISNIITSLAEEATKSGKMKDSIPSYAFIQDEQIYIAPLV